MRRFLSTAATGVLILSMAAFEASASNCVWTGAVDNSWTTNANWNSCNASFPDEVTDNALVDITANITVPNGVFPFQFNNLTLGKADGSAKVTITASTPIKSGVDLTMYSGTKFVSAVIATHTLSGNLWMKSGSTMTHTPAGTSVTAKLVFSVGGNFVFETDALIALKAAGMAGGNSTFAGNSDPAGGGHGGGGGSSGGGGGAGHGTAGGPGGGTGFGSGGAAGDMFDDPQRMGSGGGGGVGVNNPTRFGGGAVILRVTGSATLDGLIDAPGDPGVTNATTGAGGSAGGSVNILAASLLGGGTVQASGGAGGNGTVNPGGGGAGGIVRLEATGACTLQPSVVGLAGGAPGTGAAGAAQGGPGLWYGGDFGLGPDSAADIGVSSINWTFRDQCIADFPFEVYPGSNTSVLYSGLASPFLEVNLEPNTPYGRRISAKKGPERSRLSQTVTYYTYAAEPAAAAPAFFNVGYSSLAFQWLANQNPAGTEYEAQLSTAADFTGSADISSGWITAVTTAPAGLTPETTYYARVRARNANSIQTDFLTVGSMLTLPYCGTSASTKSGLWSSPGLWDSGFVPGRCTATTIGAGHTVTVDTGTAVSSTMTIVGTLYFARGMFSSMTVVEGDITVRAGGALDMGSAGDPLGADTTAHLVLAIGSGSNRYGLTIEDGGNFSLYGAAKSPWGYATQTIASGSSSFSIAASSASGWRVGDSIAIGPTDRTMNGTGAGSVRAAVITGFSGVDPLTVSFTPAMDTTRVNTATSPIVIANLTRNALVRSSGTDTATTGNSAYLFNLTAHTTGFAVSYGEFAHLGQNIASQRGITFSASARGAISSSTVRNGWDGVYLNGTRFCSLDFNNFFGNADYGLAFMSSASSNTVRSNNSMGNSARGFFLNGGSYNELIGNNAFSNSERGLYLFGSAVGNMIELNSIFANGEMGIRLDASSSKNVIAANRVYGNQTRGAYISSSNNNILAGNDWYSNLSEGVYLSAANDIILLRENIFSNGTYGLFVSGSQYGTVLESRLGYDPDGLSAPDGSPEIGFQAGGGVQSLELQGARINPASGLYTPLDAAGSYMLSYDQDDATGTLHLYGDYAVDGSTLTLDHSLRLYGSTASTPQLIRGVGHTAQVCTTSDAFAKNEIISVEYRGPSWFVTGSDGSTGSLNAGSCTDPDGQGRYTLNITQASPLPGDRFVFLIAAASPVQTIQKRLVFHGSGFADQRSHLRVLPNAGVVFSGKSDGTENTLIEMAAGATYYRLVSSGAFTAINSSFTNMDRTGIELALGPNDIKLSSTTFDYMGFNAGTNTYITLRDLNSTLFADNLTFGVSRSSHGFESAHNIRTEGDPSGTLWTVRTASGALWGEPFDDDTGSNVSWDAGCAPRTSVRSGLWSSLGTWDPPVAPIGCSESTIAPGHTVVVDTDTATSSTMTVGGTLYFARAQFSSMTIVGGDITVVSGGVLNMGTEADPLGPDTTAHLVLALGYGASERHGLIVNNGGSFSVRGATKSPYGFATASLVVGAATLGIAASSSTGWNAGDIITIGPTSRSVNGTGPSSVWLATITAITGGGTVRTVTFAPPLDSTRTKTAETPIIVSNLTRNALVRSSGTSTATAGDTAYIRNLSQSAAGFALAYGEFAHLGYNTNGRYGITFDGSGTRGSISSSTLRGGYYGLMVYSASGNEFGSNLVYGNDNGIQFIFSPAARNILRGNVVNANSSLGLYINGAMETDASDNYFYSNAGDGLFMLGPTSKNIFSRNFIFNNASNGVRLQSSANNNTFESNTVKGNQSRGISLDGSSNNSFSGNEASSNVSEGIFVYGNSNGNLFAGNDSHSNGSDGIFTQNSSKDNIFIDNLSYSNTGPGFRQFSAGANTIVGGALGYDPNGGGAPNGLNEVRAFASNGQALTMKGVRVNPSVGIGLTGLDQADAYILSYDQDYATGTLRVYGDYEVANSTLTLDYASRLYSASFSPSKLMRGTGHSSVGCTINEASAISQVITAVYNGAAWEVSGSSSGFLGTIAAGSCVDPGGSGQFSMNITQGTPAAGDRIDFAITAASPVQAIQKRLIFHNSDSGYLQGRARLRVAPTGGIKLLGDEATQTYTLIEMATGSTYYRLISSGAFTAAYSSFTNMDHEGIELALGPNDISLSSSTFDYLGFNGSTNSYLTLRDLNSSTGAFHLAFEMSRSSDGFESAHNIRVEGTDTGTAWTVYTPAGSYWGEKSDDDPNNRVVWVDTLTAVALSTPTYPADRHWVTTATFNFAWYGPSTSVAQGLGAGASFYLELDDTENFSSIVFSTTTMIVVGSTQTAFASAVSTGAVSLADNTTYYWRVRANNAVSDEAAAWSGTYRFFTDFADPVAGEFSVEYSTGGKKGFDQFTDVISGATLQLRVSDFQSGLSISTGALPGQFTVAPGGFGVVLSTDGGVSFRSLKAAVSNNPVVVDSLSLAVFRGRLYAGYGSSGTDGSIDVYDGSSWTQSRAGSLPKVNAFAEFGGKLYAAMGGQAAGADIWVCDPGGPGVNADVCDAAAEWTVSYDAGGVDDTDIYDLEVYNGQLYAAMAGPSAKNNAKVLVFDGTSWGVAGVPGTIDGVYALAAFNGKLFAGTGGIGGGNGEIYAFDGYTWTSVYSSAGTLERVGALVEYAGGLWAGGTSGTAGKILVSTIGAGGLWSESTATVRGINAFGVFDGQLFAGEGSGTAGEGDILHRPGLDAPWFRTYDGGADAVRALIAYDNSAFAAEEGGDVIEFSKLFYSTMTGGDGALNEFITAIVDLENSTTTAVCDGVTGGSCLATNQVAFIATDLSGRVLTAGPYSILADATPAPTLYAPAAGAFVSTTNPVFVFSVSTPTLYETQIGADASFNSILLSTKTFGGVARSSVTLSHGTQYWWRVRRATETAGDPDNWSATGNFTVDLADPFLGAALVDHQASFATAQTLPNAVYEATTTLHFRVVVQDGVSGLRVSTGVPDSLIAQWHFDESTGSLSVADASGQGRDGAAVGASVTQGVRGNARQFNGTDWIRMPPDSFFDIGNTDVTLSAWFRQTTLGSTRRIFGRGSTGGGYFLQTSSNKPLVVCSDGPNAYTLFSPVPVTDQAWHHLAATCSDTAIRLFVDGVEVSSMPATGLGTLGGTQFNIGSRNNGLDQFWAGDLDELRLYSRALSAGEIADQFQSDSLNAHASTRAFSVSISTTGGVTWTPVSTETLTLGGSNGSTGAENLTAAGFELTTTTAPLANTNMIAFAVADLAGNVSTRTYTVLVDTITPASISTPTYPGDGDYLKFAKPTFLWKGPSAEIVAGLGAGASYFLEVDDDPGFASIDIGISTGMTAPSGIGFDAAAYVSTVTLPAGSTFYWRVRAYNAALQRFGEYSTIASFVVDPVNPVESLFASVSSTGGLIAESRYVNLTRGVTVQINFQDALAGLAVSSSVVPGDQTLPPGGFSVIWSTNAGHDWRDVGASGASLTGQEQFRGFAQFRGRLYTGQGSGGGDADIYYFDGTNWILSRDGTENYITAFAEYAGRLYAGTGGAANGDGKLWVCAPETTGDAQVCESGDWSFLTAYGDAYQAVTALTVYDGVLYSGTFSDIAPGSGDVYAFDGTNTVLSFDDAVTDRILGFTVYNGELYFGRGSPFQSAEGDVFKYDGAAWRMVYDTAHDHATALAVADGKLFAGFKTAAGAAQLEQYNGAAWSVEFTTDTASSFESIAAANGRLYLGSAFTGQASLYTFTPSTWVKLYQGSNDRIESMIQYGGDLFASEGGSQGKVLRFSSLAASTMTGSDGTVGLETLKGFVDLVPSTNTETCGGSAPCGATNQVAFTALDRAGNLRVVGPFAVRVPGCGPLRSVQSGNWSDPDTWTPQFIPSDCNPVTIAANTEVTLDIMNAVSSATVVEGTLKAHRTVSSSYTLVGGSLTVAQGGYLDYGFPASPVLSSATIVLAYGDAPARYGLVVEEGGRFDAYGAPKEIARPLQSDLAAGVGTVDVVGDPTSDWAVGDLIAVTPSQGSGVSSVFVSSISGFSGQDLVMTGTAPQIHYSTWQVTAANLTRNIVVQSSGTVATNSQAYVAIRSTGLYATSLSGVEFVGLGYNPEGDSLDGIEGVWVGGNSASAYISSCVFRGGREGLVVYQATNVVVHANIAYDSVNYGFLFDAVSQATITYNGGLANTGQGARIVNSGGAYVVGNTFSGNGGYGMSVHSSGGHWMHSNRFTANANRGLTISGISNGIAVLGSTSSFNSAEGIAHQGTDAFRLYVNTSVIVGNGGDGLMFAARNRGFVLLNNEIARNGGNGVEFGAVSSSAIAAGNSILNNSGSGMRFTATGGNTLFANTVLSNGGDGISYVTSVARDRLIYNDLGKNSESGLELNNASEVMLISNTVHGNGDYGLYYRGAEGVYFQDGSLGYDALGASDPNSPNEAHIDPATLSGMELRRTRINPAVGISTAGITGPGRYIATFAQNFDTGTLRVYGFVPFAANDQMQYTYDGNSMNVEISSAVAMWGDASAIINNRQEAAKGGLWVIEYTGSNWCLREPLAPEGTCVQTWATDFTGTIGSPPQFDLTFDDNTPGVKGDTVHFAIAEGARDKNTQKKILFGPTAASYRNGQSGFEFVSQATFTLRGIPGYPTIMDTIDPGQPYYTIQSSGPVYLEHSSITNISKDGFWFSGDPGKLFIASTTFDFMGVESGSDAAYFTYASDLPAVTTTFYGVQFGLSRATAAATNAYNIRVVGGGAADFTMRKWSGLMGGATNQWDASNTIKWAPFQPSSATVTATAVWQTSMTHVWSAAVDPVNDPGVFYRVFLSSAQDFSGDIFSSTTARDVFDASVEGLSANTTYYSVIYAVDVGTAPFLPLEIKSTLAKPLTPAPDRFFDVQVGSITAAWIGLPATPLAESAEGYVVGASSTNFDGSGVNHTSSTYVLDASTLTVGLSTPLLANTTYWFRAASVNHAGALNYIEFGSTATLSAVPGPGSPNISEVNFSSATLVWTTNNNPAGTQYRTQASTASDFSGAIVGDDYWNVFTSTGMTGLFANTTYYFRVQSRNWNGLESDFLVLGDSVTLAFDAASAVSTFTAVAETTLTAAWDSGGNGPGTLYEAVLSTETGFQNGNTGDVVKSTRPQGATTADFTGLSANTTYYFSVRAISHGGAAGAWLALGSTSTLAAVPTADPAPFGEVYQSSASARWGNGGNAVSVTTYTVAMSTEAAYPNANSGTVGFSTTPVGTVPGAFFTNLESNATYYLFAAALNQAGAPTLFNQVGSTVTLVRVPATAVSTFSSVHQTSMTVSWDSNGNTRGTRYDLVLTTGTTFPNAFPDNIVYSTDSQSYPVASFPAESLVSNSTYYFHIRAEARDGTKTAYASLGSTVTLAAEPLAGGTPYFSAEQTKLTVTWGANGNSPGTLYEAIVSSGSSYPNSFSGNVPASTRPEGVPLLTVSGLSPNTTYFTFVRAVSHDALATAFVTLGSTSTFVYAPVAAGVPITEVFQSSAVVSWGTGSNPLSVTTFTVVLSTAVSYDAADPANAVGSTVAATDPAFATVTGLAGNTTYYLFVEALDHAGRSSATVLMGSTITLAAAPTYPLVGDSTFTAVEISSVVVQWGDNGNRAGTEYQAEASTAAGFGSDLGAAVFASAWSASTNTAFIGLSTNAVYHFRVKARNAGLTETLYFGLGSTTTLADIPGVTGAPFGFVGKSSASVSWTVATNPAGTEFNLEVSTDASFNPVAVSSGWSPAVSAVVAPLLGATTYYFRVAARNSAGVLSPFADLGATRTAISPPSDGIVADLAPRSVRLDFNGGGNRGGESIGAWTAATALPAARYAQANAVSEGRVYMTGGVLGGAPTAEVWRADIGSDGSLGAWKAQTPLPAARESHALVASGGRLYAIGGFAGAAKTEVYWAPLAANGDVGPWSAAAPLPAARYRHAAAVSGGHLFVFGGDNGIFQQKTVYSAPIASDGTLGAWAAQTDLPEARAGHAVAVSSGRVIVSGGLGAGLQSTVWKADLSAGSVGAWSAETPLPSILFRHASAASRERVYVLGGYDGSAARTEVYVATVSADGSVGQWTQTTSLAAARFMHAAAFDGRHLFAFGGSDGAVSLSTVESGVLDGIEYLTEAASDAGFSTVVSSSGWRPGTSVEVAGLTPNTTYYLRARAREAVGAETADLSFGELLVPAALPVSAASTFTAVESSSLGVVFLDGGNAAGTEFQVEASTAADFTGTDFFSGWTTALSTAVPGLTPSTSYFLRVQARDRSGLGSPYAALGATWTAAATPTGETISAVQTTGFTLSWNANGNPSTTLFEAVVSTESNFASTAASSATRETSAIFAGLVSASTFYARVRAVNGAGVPTGYTATASTTTGVDVVAPGKALGAAAYQSGSSSTLVAFWEAPGDDAFSGELVAGSRFFVQWSAGDPAAVAWSTGAAQVQIATGPVAAGATVGAVISGLPAHRTVSLRVWTEDEAGNYSVASDTFSAFASPFAFETISAAGVSVATTTALTLDAQDRLVAAYGDAVSGQVRVRLRSGGTWSGAETADSGGAGRFVSVAVDAAGGVHAVGMGSLRYSSRTAAGSWATVVPDPNGEGHGSVAVDGGGSPQILYNQGTAANHSLRYARYEAGAWTTATVDATVAKAGRFPSAALSGNGLARVAYSDTTNGTLKYAAYDGSSWTAWSVDSVGTGDARSSLALDADEGIHIAYRDNATLELKYASAPAPGLWGSLVIDAGAAVGTPALALDGSGRPHIAYTESATGSLKYARFDGVAWSTQTVDSRGTVDGRPGIVVSGTGEIWISYRGADGALKVASWSGGFSGGVGGNASGRGRAPYNLSGVPVSATSVQWTWLDNASNELGYRLYGSESSTGPYALISGTDTISAVTGKGTLASFVETGLTSNTTYYRFVAAVNAGGVAVSSIAAAFPFNTVDATPPTITVNQTGDSVWRSSNSGSYDVDFSDLGGGGLDRFRVKASTVPGGAGPDLVAFTDVVVSIGSNTFSADWALPAAVWNALLEGVTNYITIEASDGLGNSTTTLDGFFVLKDTTTPTLTDNQTGDDAPRGAAGTLYDVDALDTGSGIAAFQYSASLIQGSGDASLIGWTNIPLTAGATSFSADWAVDFANLATGVTNYISVRLYDLTGASATATDAFYVIKDVSPSLVAVVSPTETYRSALPTISGTASDPSGVGGVQVSVQRSPGTGLYWNGSGFLSVTRVWLAASGTATWTYSPGIPWVDATQYQIVARSSDTLGNFSTVFATATFTFDASSPTASAVTPAPLSTVGALPTIAGTASDAGAGVSSVELRLRRNTDGLWWDFGSESWTAVPVSSVTVGTGSWSLQTTEVLRANLADQTSYFIAVRATDLTEPALSGDFFAGGSTFTFRDTTPPSPITTLSALRGANPGELALSWTAPGDDGDAGTSLLATYRIHYSTVSGTSFSTASAQIQISTALASPGRLELYTAAGLDAGATYYLRVWAQDDASNWSPVSNGATAYATPQPLTKVLGHVMNVSSQGITGVFVEAYDGSNALISSTHTIADSSGTYVLDNVTPGNYTVRVTYEVDEIASSVWIDGVPMGTGDLDFFLEIQYTLGEITGTLGALATEGRSPSGFMVAAAESQFKRSEIELFQRNKRIASVGIDPTGRWRIPNLLPGRYAVRAFNGFEFTKLQEVYLLEGESRSVAFVFDPLPADDVFAFPNPARDSTTIRFRTALPGLEAEIRVFDIAGNLVKEIPGSDMTSPQPGLYHAVWNLQNNDGEGVASGVYLFIVKVKGSTGQTAKVVKKLAIVK